MSLSSAFLLVLFSRAVNPSDSYSLSRKSCPPGYVSCQVGENWHRGNGTCLEEGKVCDNSTDCSDGSDEKYCSFDYNYGESGFVYRFVQGPCPNDYFMCPSGKHIYIDGTHVFHGDVRCIHKSWLCDGDIDCGNHSDENFCPYNLTTGFQHTLSKCQTGYFLCKSTAKLAEETKCLPITSMCDGKNDCDNELDEIYCPYVFSEELSTERFEDLTSERTSTTPLTSSRPTHATVRHVPSTSTPTTETAGPKQAISHAYVNDISNLLDKQQFNSQIAPIRDQLTSNKKMLSFVLSLSVLITVFISYFVVSNYMHRRHCYRFQDVNLLHLPNTENMN